MDDTDRGILDRLQAAFPLVQRPFAALGEELGLGEQEVVRRVRALHEAGLIRRIGPVLDPASLGRVSALAAMAVPADRLVEAAATVSACDAVTHNYERIPRRGSCPYTLWFTVSAGSEAALDRTLAELSEVTGLPIVKLATGRKFKIGVRFAFAEEDAGG